MLGLVAGKSCNLWVSCNFRVLQLVGYRLYVWDFEFQKIGTGTFHEAEISYLYNVI